MKKVWVIVLVVCVLLVLVAAVAIRAAVLKSRRGRTEREMLKGVCDVAVDGTIFVGIVNDTGNSNHAAATALSLFKEAECPMRVHVNVYDIVRAPQGSSASSAFMVSLRDHARAVGFPMDKTQHLVRVLQIPTALYRGPLAAREQLERFTFADETYMLTIQAGAVLATGWDRTCIAALLGTGSPTAYLTTRLEVSADAFPLADGRQPATFVAFTPESARECRVVSYKLRKASRVAARPKPRHQTQTQTPKLNTATNTPLLHPPPETTPAIAWCSSFAFTYGRRHAAFRLPMLPDINEDAAMWNVLVLHGWTQWHHPLDTVAVVGAGAAAASATMTAALELPTLSPSILHLMGLGPTALMTPTTRARVGLTAVPTKDEIEAKLGTMDDYASLITRLELTNI
jgi:hypothetical protein